MTKTVGDLGEQGLLKKLQKFCPKDIVGDDGAIVTLAAQHNLVVTTDVLVDGVHFSDRTTPPESVGWRAAAANLSDLAAMGANPVGITIGLSLTPHTTVSWVESLYQGMSNCLGKYQTCILGGDIVRSRVNSLAITALGEILPHQAIRRSTAQPGDAIVVTGFHGDSRGGLELLLNREIGQNLSSYERESLIKAHQYPTPRLDILEHLGKIKINHSVSVAGMDSSDGLADAILQICQFSGVGATLEYPAIAISPVLKELVNPEQTLSWALYGGEDFELVLCLAPEMAENLIAALDTPAAIVGKITSEKVVKIINCPGINSEISLSLKEGFQHFSH